MEGRKCIYSGSDTKLYLPRASDKRTVLTPGENHKGKTKQAMFYTELWFVALIAVLALILLAIFLSLILQRKISTQPFARERPPLVSLQKSISPMSVYLPGETHMLERVADTSEASHSITLKSYTMHFQGLSDKKLPGLSSPLGIHNKNNSVHQAPSQSQIQDMFPQGSLHRSVSQLIDVYDKKSLIDNTVWDAIIHGCDSSLYMDDDLVSAMKSFSTVTKEHTTFTDTHL